jgi:hypothetical protein
VEFGLGRLLNQSLGRLFHRGSEAERWGFPALAIRNRQRDEEGE